MAAVSKPRCILPKPVQTNAIRRGRSLVVSRKPVIYKSHVNVAVGCQNRGAPLWGVGTAVIDYCRTIIRPKLGGSVLQWVLGMGIESTVCQRNMFVSPNIRGPEPHSDIGLLKTA